ncbi:hypothetical protein CIPAW_07G029400 [Carya illinoinensis]|uniref:TRF2/HOY1 PH-like domain-containing protein n=1 Tax=Carya illinoinensis TaxID=32201 RepID=A0A8T1PX22_CARIL|nr:hypothetical protein CIPAW_07G029400 [Carya illinoinensis]
MAHGGRSSLNEQMHCEFSASDQQFQPVNDNRSISAWEVQISEPTNERLRQTPTDTENKMHCGVSTSEQYFQKAGLQSVNNDGSKASEVQISETANERLRQTPAEHTEKEDIELRETLLKLPPIGLTFTKTDSFLDLVGRKILHANNSSRCGAVQAGWVEAKARNDAEKLKASNFCASFLRIGSWEEVSKREGALVAKFYYAKRKLVWEIMKDGLKSKIEIQWSDILAIRASITQGQPGILEIELNTPPMFYQEIDPMPRKHTIWKTTSDFTDGQALIHRRHYIEFPPGNLDKHLDKLLQCDSRMSMLSTRPFPSLPSPYFHSAFNNETRQLSMDYNGDRLNMNFSYQLPYYASTPSPLALVQQVQAYEQTNQPYFPANDSTGMIVDFTPQLDENVSNLVQENSRMATWNQVMIHSKDLLGRDRILEPFSRAIENQVREQIQEPFSIAIENQGRDQIQDPFSMAIENQVRDQIDQDPFAIAIRNQVRDQIQDPFSIAIENHMSNQIQEPFTIAMPAQVNPTISYQNYNMPAPYAEQVGSLFSDIDSLNNLINKFHAGDPELQRNTGDLELQCIDQKGYIAMEKSFLREGYNR